MYLCRSRTLFCSERVRTQVRIPYYSRSKIKALHGMDPPKQPGKLMTQRTQDKDYEFTEGEERILKSLSESIQTASDKYGGLLLTALFLVFTSCVTAPSFAAAKGTLFSGAADIANAFLLWILSKDLASRFQEIVSTSGRDIPLLFSAVEVLRVLFSQLAMIAACLGGAVNIASASSKWPETAHLVSLVAIVWTFARLMTLRTRGQTREAFYRITPSGLMDTFAAKAEGEAKKAGDDLDAVTTTHKFTGDVDRPYEFSERQERQLVYLSEAVFYAAFGFFVSASAKALAVAANTVTGSLGFASLTAMGVYRDFILAGLLFRLGNILEEIIVTEGKDIDRFMSGITKAGGLADFFAQSAGVISGISRFQIFDAVARLFVVYGAKYLGLKTWDSMGMWAQIQAMVVGT